jgi:hypothetical protein
LPQHPEEKHDGAGKELRMFLDSIGIKKYVVLHSLKNLLCNLLTFYWFYNPFSNVDGIVD